MSEGAHTSAPSSRVSCERYRSPGLPPGQFRQLGNIHVHVDGANSIQLVIQSLEEFGRGGCQGKLNLITDSVAGPQRSCLAETYDSHTPGVGPEERFEYFSTAGLANRSHAITALRGVLSRLAGNPGIVVEAERVVASVEGNGKWSAVPVDVALPIRSAEVGLRCSPTLPFEIHHGFEVNGTGARLDLKTLVRHTTELGLDVGGWYSFAKPRVWAYRSNGFFGAEGLEEHTRIQYELLKRYVRRTELDCRIWTLVEQIIGVWRMPTTQIPAG
jgi:hypothetical protein